MVIDRNEFLDHEISDASDHDDGYDSEAGEAQKDTNRMNTGSRAKRRKLSHSSDELEWQSDDDRATTKLSTRHLKQDALHEEEDQAVRNNSRKTQNVQPERFESEPEDSDFKIKSASTAVKQSQKQTKRESASTPGVVYLSSLPPYLKPSALRNILQQRGFEPITRLFLAPASKAKSSSKKNSRQLYTEGWIEFASKRTARRCAESLNANIIGGKKGGFYHDDIWNMKYLKGMAWDELMAGIREERREEEGRRDEERRIIAKETQRFLDGVEEGKRVEGMKRKRKAKEQSTTIDEGGPDIKRTWRQFEVKGNSGSSAKNNRGQVGDDVKAILGKIF